MTTTMKKVTFSLPGELLDALKKHVHDLQLPSVNHVVREALESRVKELEQEKLRQVIGQAARDAAFLKDVEECMADFRHIDKECKHIE